MKPELARFVRARLADEPLDPEDLTARLDQIEAAERSEDGLATLQIMALAFSDHADYVEQWRP